MLNPIQNLLLFIICESDDFLTQSASRNTGITNFQITFSCLSPLSFLKSKISGISDTVSFYRFAIGNQSTDSGVLIKCFPVLKDSSGGGEGDALL
ncbi:MAG TPA: hypothetical protein VKY57_11365 [Chitinispirillaceae bacterium]|nr:hypothetical protein [Chitinispirillaceae bacterium]